MLGYHNAAMCSKGGHAHGSSQSGCRTNAHAKLVHQGALLQAKIDPSKSKRPPVNQCRPQRRAKRGPVRRVWSRKSRANFIKTVLKLTPSFSQGTNYSITLTYREREPRESKGDLHTFRMRLRRYLKDNPWFALWKMEFQQRGTVHYHIVLNVQNTVPISEMRTFVSNAWSEIVQDPQLAITGTRVDEISLESVRQVIFYLVGHATTHRKDYQNCALHTDWVGRWFGVWNPPEVSAVEVSITESELHRLKRTLAKIRPISPCAKYSYWAACDESLFNRIVGYLMGCK
jgi:hypothetical protein